VLKHNSWKSNKRN